MMKTDINGVPYTYENKDELVFDIEDKGTYRGSTQEILNSPEFQKEYNEWLDTDLKQERTDILYQDWLEEYNREYRNEM